MRPTHSHNYLILLISELGKDSSDGHIPTPIMSSELPVLNLDAVVAIALGVPSLLIASLSLWVAYLTFSHSRLRMHDCRAIGLYRQTSSWPACREPLSEAELPFCAPKTSIPGPVRHKPPLLVDRHEYRATSLSHSIEYSVTTSSSSTSGKIRV